MPGVGGGGGDDLGAGDLSTTSPSDDLSRAPDLTSAPDLTTSHDLAGAHDLSTPPDLASADLTSVPDLTAPPDLTGAPDLSTICTPPVSSGACGDYPPQCGCASGQNCLVVDTSSGATGCVAAGSIPSFGGGCSGSGAGQCGIGAACVGGVCTPICKNAGDCGGGYNTCAQVNNSSGTAIPGFTVCSRTCDPVSPQSSASPYAACGASTNCLPASDHGSFCIAPVGSGTQGSDCTTASAPDQSKCAASYACISTDPFGFTGTCFKMCHVGSNVDCPSGKTCGSFGTKLYAGPTEIGYCS